MEKDGLRGLSELQAELVEQVQKELGEIPAASLEVVFRKGHRAMRFQGINLVQLRRICILADQAGVHLPTKEI